MAAVLNEKATKNRRFPKNQALHGEKKYLCARAKFHVGW
jgi:hypothetical protein